MTKLLRTLLGGGARAEREHARAEIERASIEARREGEADLRACGAVMAARGSQPHLDLGRTTAGAPLRIPLANLDGAHAWWSGSTGSGKTSSAGRFVQELLRRQRDGAPVSVVAVGLQGNFVELVTQALAADLQRAPSGTRADVTSRLTVARFFSGGFLPEWQILAPTPHATPLVQAASTGEILETSLGAALGHRQDTALTALLALAITEGLTLIELRLLLGAPKLLAARGSRSKEVLIRSYFTGRFATESAATLDGIASRLDRLLGLDDGLRGALAGPGTIDFEALFEPGHVALFDFARTPLGAEGVRRALAALVLQSLAGAAVSASRRVRGMTVILIDEAQLALTPGLTRTFETLLATVRQFRVSLCFLQQSLVQLPGAFVQLLSTNLRYRFLGRCGREDGRLSEEFLPRIRTARGQDGRAPRDGRTRGENEEARFDRLGNLPARHFYYTERAAPFGPVEIEAADFRPPPLSSYPAALRDALARGRSGRPRAELIRHARTLEDEVMREIEADASARTEAKRVRTFGPDVHVAGNRWTRGQR